MDNVQTLVNKVSRKLEALETAQSLYGRQLSPQFSIFDYINTDELGLSKIIGDLLNPKGSHGQQESFLRLFIEHCLPRLYQQESPWQAFIDHLKHTSVHLEEQTGKSDSLRRMDIYLRNQVKGQSYGICIENKPYAADQRNQLTDYALELDKRQHSSWHIIYISEHSDAPSEYSVKAETLKEWTEQGRFTAVRFSQLIKWLKACQVECQNHSVNEFIIQFIKFIQKQFMGIEDMNEDNAVLDIINQSPESIDASIKIANNVYHMKKQLIEKLKKDLKNLCAKCEHADYQLDLSYIGEGNNYEQINLKISSFDVGYICFEFQSRDFNRPYIGIKFNSEEDGRPYFQNAKMRTVLNQELTDKKISSSSLWPAGYYFNPQDWQRSSDAWLMIHDGSMASKILEEMDKIYHILKDHGCFVKN